MADPLATVLRLRRLAVDQAKSALAVALREAGQAEAAHDAAMHLLVQEARGAPHDAADRLAGSFAAWLPKARADIAGKETVAIRKSAAEDAARARLAGSHAALAAAESLDRRRHAEAALKPRRKTQLANDEAGMRGRFANHP